MASYDDGTCPRLLILLDKIRLGETLPFVCRLELLSEIIVTDATGVDHRVWRQHVLVERRRLKDENGIIWRMWNIQLHLERHSVLHHQRRRPPGVP